MEELGGRIAVGTAPMLETVGLTESGFWAIARLASSCPDLLPTNGTLFARPMEVPGPLPVLTSSDVFDICAVIGLSSVLGTLSCVNCVVRAVTAR